MALSGFGIPISQEQVKSVRGRSKRQALFSLLPPGPDQTKNADSIYSAFLTHLKKQYESNKARALPGTEEAFGYLKENGVLIALTTGFDREITTCLIEALGWTEGQFGAVVCSDDVSRGRPAPYMIFKAMESVGVDDVHTVANVGDTVQDLQAGYNAGIRWNVGVLSGAHDRKMLEEAPHTHILSSVAELPDVFRFCIGK